MKCVEFCENDMYKRKVDTKLDLLSPPFTDYLKKEVDNNLMYINDLLLQFGHEGIPFEKYEIK